jgi:hypothetical protein
MITLTILNTLAILYLIVSKKTKLYFEFRKEITSFDETLVGYRLVLSKRLSDYSSSSVYQFYLPIKDKRKTEMTEEANRMIAKYSQQNKLQSLTAKFSWLKTWDEVKEFQKYYTVVDRRIVENLVSNFLPKAQ